MTSSKKLALLFFFIATVSCISQQCVVELTKLAADITKLTLSVQSGNAIAIASYTIKTAKQVTRVKLACQAQGLMRSKLEFQSIKQCINATSAFFIESQTILNEYKSGQDYLQHAFINQVVSLGQSVDPLLNICALAKLEKIWISYLPENCINILGDLANDVSTLRDDKDKPIAYMRALLKFKKDSATAKTVCPFIQE